MELVHDGNLKWRYQLINYGTDDQPDLKLHEVYFDVNTGKIIGWMERPYQISGYENSNDIIDDLKIILKDIQKNAPVNLRIYRISGSKGLIKLYSHGRAH